MQGLTAKSAGKEAHTDDFQILHTIGEGTFGKVKLVRHILTGTQVAVKVIKKRRQSFSSAQALFREVCSLKALNHPNIVKLLGVIDTEETFFVVMEYLSGGGHVPLFEDPWPYDRGRGPRPVPAAGLCPAALPPEGHRAPRPEATEPPL